MAGSPEGEAVMNPNRRGFLIGVAAVLATASAPIAANAEVRAAPVFVLRGPITSPYLDSLIPHLRDLFQQVAAFAPAPSEYDAVTAALEEALWPVRPCGVRIVFETTLAEMQGSFGVFEDGMGTVKVKSWPSV